MLAVARRGRLLSMRVLDPRAFVFALTTKALRPPRSERPERKTMLHMIVNTHNAESCAFRGEEEDKILTGGFERIQDVAAQNEISFEGSWVNRATHEIFMLVDAPNAHVVEETLLAAGLVGRTHSRILPVISTQQALETEFEHQH